MAPPVRRKQLIRSRRRLDAPFVDADLAGRGHDRRPDVIGQRHTIRKPLRAHPFFGLAGCENFATALYGARALHRRDVARDLVGKRGVRIHAFGIDVERQHAVREWPPVLCRTGAAERAPEQLADQRQPGTLVLAESANRTPALAIVARASARFVIPVEQMRIAAHRAIRPDQCVGRQLLAATARDQHLAFGNDRSGEIENDRIGACARNADAERRVENRRSTPPNGATSTLPAALTKWTEINPASAAIAAQSPTRPIWPALRRATAARPCCRHFSIPSSTACGATVWPKPKRPSTTASTGVSISGPV